MKRSAFFFNHPKQVISGGHKYNDALLNCLEAHHDVDTVAMPRCAEMYSSWRKAYAPLAELKWMRMVKRHDLVFVDDSCFRYHLLLLLVLRILGRGTPIVIIHHFPYLNDRGLTRIVNFVWQYIYYALCRFLIVPSPYTLDVARKLYPGKRIFYIPIPFENRFETSDDEVEGRLLFVGTVERRKGLHYLIRALADVKKRVPSVHLDIVGKIVDNSYYRKLVDDITRHQLQTAVSFRGRVSDEALDELYRKAEVFVFPSLLEGYGMVLIEAMSHGLPVVAFDNSAMPYTIQHGVNGLLAKNRDAEALAGCIREIVGNLELRQKLQQGMRTTIGSLKTQSDFEKAVSKMIRFLG